MKFISLLSIFLIHHIHTICEKNCFLGGIFFSAPLDETGCCRYDWNKNCSRFIQVNEGNFICDRCKI